MADDVSLRPWIRITFLGWLLGFATSVPLRGIATRHEAAKA